MAQFKFGFPGDIRVFDITGDGYADRMYAGDMGGRVWRFDISNGQTATTLVTGGVFASLGNAHLTTHPVATSQRFYSAPDVAFLSLRAARPGSTSRSGQATARTRSTSRRRTASTACATTSRSPASRRRSTTRRR
mgnify:CR=1 FL=1